MSEIKYRIFWRAIRTGATGSGTATFPHDVAQQIADQLNKENDGLTTHWIEAAEEGIADTLEKK